MPIPHDTPENPSAQEPYFEKKTAPFTDAAGTHPINGSGGNDAAGKPTGEMADDSPQDKLTSESA